MAKTNNALRFVIIGIISLILLLIIGALIFVGVTIASLNSSMAEKQQDIIVAFDVRTEATLELTSLLESKMPLDREVFDELHAAQNELDSAKTAEELSKANVRVANAIDNVIFVMKDKYLYLEGEDVIEVEDRISTATNRINIEISDYNEDAVDYNEAVSVFPGSALAKIFGFAEGVTLFEIS